MKFYQEFSRYYDYIFPLQEQKLNLLRENITAEGKILDVAAGTGNYALALAEKGCQVMGLDLSEGMIEIAREKAVSQEMDVSFKVGDMKKLSSFYSAGEFVLIYCIGNSLVHLEGMEEITDTLGQFYRLLADGGRLIIQVQKDRIRGRLGL